MLPSKEEQALTVKGFIRTNCSINFPIVLIKVISLYFNEIIYLNIKGDKLKEYLNSTKGIKVFSKKFKIKGIEFQFYASSVKSMSPYHGYSGFFLKCVSMPQTMEYVTVHCHEFCHQTLIDAKETYQLKQDKTWSFGLYSQSLKLSDCANKKEMKYCCKVDIMEIKYKANDQSLYRKVGVFMHEKVEHEWKLSEELLNKLKLITDHREIAYYGPYFDDNNWSLTCAPNYDWRGQQGLWSDLKLYHLPPNIGSVLVYVKRLVLYDDQCYVQGFEIKFSFKKHIHYFFCNLNKPLTDIKQLLFEVVITINKVYDLKGNEIPKEQWSANNIITQ